MERTIVRAVPRGVDGGIVVDDGARILSLCDGEGFVLGPAGAPWSAAADGQVIVGHRGRLRRYPQVGPPEVIVSGARTISSVASASCGRSAWWSEGVLSWKCGISSGSRPLLGTAARAPRMRWVGSHLLVAGGPMRRAMQRIANGTVVGEWQLPGPVLACAGSAQSAVVLALDLETQGTVLGLLDPDGHVELVPVSDALAWDGSGDVVAWVDETGVLHVVDVEGEVRSYGLPTREPHGIGLDGTGRSACVWQRPDPDAGAPVWVVAL